MVAHADLPGCQKEMVRIRLLRPDLLWITGERRDEKEEEEKVEEKVRQYLGLFEPGSEARRIELDLVEGEWEWCPLVAWWAFRYPRPALTYQDYFTFVTTDFVPKPLYFTVQRYARGGEP